MAEKHVLAAGARVEIDAGLQRLLDGLSDDRTAQRIRRGAIAAGANVIARYARASSAFADRSGQLRASIRVRTKPRGDDIEGYVFAGSRSTVYRAGRAISGRYKSPGGYRAAYYAAFVELGTKSHVIRARDGGMLNLGGRLLRRVQHPGVRPRRFMQTALERGRAESIAAIDRYIARRIERLQASGS